jgi:hypothetical protein
MKRPVIICVLIALTACLLQQVAAQKVLLAVSDNQLFIIDPASPNCKTEKIDLPCKLDTGSVKIQIQA